MWDRLRQIARRTSGDSRRRSRRREETERDIVGDSRETRGGTTGRARGEALRANREQASRVGHIGQHEYRYRGPAPSNSHTQSISSSNSNWSTPRSRHPLFQNHPTPPYYGPSTPPYSPPPPSYTPPPNYGTPDETSSLFEHGRRSTSSRSGSDSLVPRNQRNTAMVRHEDTDSRRQTTAGRSSRSYPPSYRSVDVTSFRSHTSREALLSPRTSHEGRSRSFRAPTRGQNHRYSYGSPERPHTSSSRDSESVYSSY